jgi:hypothetical protein
MVDADKVPNIPAASHPVASGDMIQEGRDRVELGGGELQQGFIVIQPRGLPPQEAELRPPRLKDGDFNFTPKMRGWRGVAR